MDHRALEFVAYSRFAGFHGIVLCLVAAISRTPILPMRRSPLEMAGEMGREENYKAWTCRNDTDVECLQDILGAINLPGLTNDTTSSMNGSSESSTLVPQVDLITTKSSGETAFNLSLLVVLAITCFAMAPLVAPDIQQAWNAIISKFKEARREAPTYFSYVRKSSYLAKDMQLTTSADLLARTETLHMEAIKQITTEKEELASKGSLSMKAIKQITAEKAELARTSSQRYDELEADYRALEDEKQTEVEAKDALQLYVNNLEDIKTDLRSQLEASNTQRGILLTVLGKTEDTVKDIQDHIKKQKTTATEQEGEISRLKAQVHGLEVQAQNEEDAKALLSEEHQKLQDSFQSLSGQYEEKAEKLAETAKALEASEEKLLVAGGTIRRHELTIKGLGPDLRAAARHCNTLKCVNEVLNAAVDDQEKKIRLKDGEIRRLTAELEQSKQQSLPSGSSEGQGQGGNDGDDEVKKAEDEEYDGPGGEADKVPADGDGQEDQIQGTDHSSGSPPDVKPGGEESKGDSSSPSSSPIPAPATSAVPSAPTPTTASMLSTHDPIATSPSTSHNPATKSLPTDPAQAKGMPSLPASTPANGRLDPSASSFRPSTPRSNVLPPPSSTPSHTPFSSQVSPIPDHALLATGPPGPMPPKYAHYGKEKNPTSKVANKRALEIDLCKQQGKAIKLNQDMRGLEGPSTKPHMRAVNGGLWEEKLEECQIEIWWIHKSLAEHYAHL